MNIEILTQQRSQLNEGPLWHTDEQVVYWTDIISGTLFRLDPALRQTTSILSGPELGGMTIQADGSLLLFRAKGEIAHWANGELRVVIPEIPDEVATRFNDVAADPEGRVFCGTMPTETRRGRLYRLDRDGSIRIVLEEIGCSNGIGFSPDQRTMYYIDSAERNLYAFDYHRESGDIDNQRVHWRLPEGQGTPDGMTVDVEGHLWVALWGGWGLVHLDSSGRELERISLPAERVTCPTFGGPEFRDLYVTTAAMGASDSEAGAGELLRLNPGARGIPEFRSKIQV